MFTISNETLFPALWLYIYMRYVDTHIYRLIYSIFKITTYQHITWCCMKIYVTSINVSIVQPIGQLLLKITKIILNWGDECTNGDLNV